MNLDLIYEKLYSAYGPQFWWPAETFDEIIIGTILTQNTSWLNVEKAILNLKKAEFCNLDKIAKMEFQTLAELIKPSGYFNQKAKRLINLALTLDIENIKKADIWDARRELLSINGVGPETADSMLLYAFQKPIFVIDAYTIRVISRVFGDTER